MSGSAWAASFYWARAGMAGKCVAATAIAAATAMVRGARIVRARAPALAGAGAADALWQNVFAVIEKSALLASVLSSYGVCHA
jgi:hypothetical protein